MTRALHAIVEQCLALAIGWDHVVGTERSRRIVGLIRRAKTEIEVVLEQEKPKA